MVKEELDPEYRRTIAVVTNYNYTLTVYTEQAQFAAITQSVTLTE
jgi:hypothetical protein